LTFVNLLASEKAIVLESWLSGLLFIGDFKNKLQRKGLAESITELLEKQNKTQLLEKFFGIALRELLQLAETGWRFLSSI